MSGLRDLDGDGYGDYGASWATAWNVRGDIHVRSRRTGATLYPVAGPSLPGSTIGNRALTVDAQCVPTDGQGTANAILTVPSDPSVLALQFFNQFVTVDDAPLGRPLPVTAANVGRGVIGF